MATATDTATMLQSMFTENTGRHFLDSGGAYGRAWERNQGHTMADDPAVSMSIREYRDGDFSIDITLSAYHFLAERLEYNAAVDKIQQRICKLSEDPYLVDAETLAELLQGRGIYGDGKWFTVNNYNGEDALSQTLQYVYCTLDEEVNIWLRGGSNMPERVVWNDGENGDLSGWYNEDGELATRYSRNVVTVPGGTYIILQVHGGCDVRGGYTQPRVFTDETYDGTSMFDNARVELYCTGDKVIAGQQELIVGHDAQHIWLSENGGYSFDSVENIDDANIQNMVTRDADDTLHLICPHCGSTVEAGPYPVS